MVIPYIERLNLSFLKFISKCDENIHHNFTATAISQIAQLFPSASQANPFIPQSAPQEFFIFHPDPPEYPINTTA
jgi:hypothetical protein